MANVVDVTDATFQSEVLESDMPVLVDFGATWCGPCKQLAPLVEQLAKDNAGKLKVVAVDIDKARDASMRYGVMSVPTILMFRGGEVKEQLFGPFTKPSLQDKINRVIS